MRSNCDGKRYYGVHASPEVMDQGTRIPCCITAAACHAIDVTSDYASATKIYRNTVKCEDEVKY
jgi:hypothetical protein